MSSRHSLSLIEGFYWVIASVAFFVSFIAAGIVLTLLMFVVWIISVAVSSSEANEITDYSGSAVLLFGYTAVFGYTGSFLLSFGFLLIWGVIILLKFDDQQAPNLASCIVGLFLGALIFFLVWVIGYRGSNAKHKKLYAYYQNRIEYLKDAEIPQNMEVLRNPFLFDYAIDSLKTEVKSKIEKVQIETDSLQNELILLQNGSKKQVLTVKRVWLNSDVAPWTYQAYTSIHLSAHSNLFFSSANLRINGNGKYVGDNRFDYVNIVFSDNSFHQFKVKDAPEWLLAKKGDKVEVYNGKFVPLFKK